MLVTEIRPNKKNDQRVSVFIDDEFGFSCYIETAEDERLRTGMEISADVVARIRAADGERFAWNCAVRYAGRGLKTEHQVRTHLRERDVDEDLIDVILGRLREYRFVDDEEYADLYAKRLYEKYGRRLVIQRLLEKGISEPVARNAAAEPCEPSVLLRHVERLISRARDEDVWRRDGRIMRSLIAKGFEPDAIRRAIKDVERGFDDED